MFSRGNLPETESIVSGKKSLLNLFAFCELRPSTVPSLTSCFSKCYSLHITKERQFI